MAALLEACMVETKAILMEIWMGNAKAGLMAKKKVA
jgi:hypothetical protein